MANLDGARGFWPHRHLSGGEVGRPTEYTLTTGATVFQGELVKIVAGGTVEQGAADIGTAAIGVAAHYADDSASAGGVKVLVYDDPNIVFGVQSDSGTATTAADVGATANHVAGTGNTTTKISTDELDASDIGTGAQLKIIGLIPRPDNAWGEHSDLEVIFNEHHYKAAVAGV